MPFVGALLAATALVTVLAAQAPAHLAVGECGREVDHTPLSQAQRLFYNGQYELTAELTSGAREAAQSLALCELRAPLRCYSRSRQRSGNRGTTTEQPRGRTAHIARN